MGSKTNRRIGIYAGTFDPVHAGHLAFALQAIEAAQLDAVYFLPERRPRHKTGVEHFGHRVAMLRQAIRPHRQLRLLELEDISFSVARSLPRLQRRFRGAQLVFLVGSDVATGLPAWDHYEELCRQAELMVGLRSRDNPAALERQLATWPLQPRNVTLIDSFAATVSSGQIREALRRRQTIAGLLPSVVRYSNRNWLYVSVAG